MSKYIVTLLMLKYKYSFSLVNKNIIINFVKQSCVSQLKFKNQVNRNKTSILFVSNFIIRNIYILFKLSLKMEFFEII